MTTHQRQLVEQGPVARLVVPEGWLEQPVPRRGDFDITTLRKFTPAEKDNVQLVFHYRGLPISGNQAQNFQHLLAQEPHELVPEEWWLVQEVLNRMAIPDEFHLNSVRTQLVNQRTVLIAEGSWATLDFDMCSMFIDIEGDGNLVQEIYYAAPADEYQLYLPLFNLAVSTIEWKPLTVDLPETEAAHENLD